MPEESAVNQLTFLYNTFCQALDMVNEVRVVFCDIRKAFDRVWHAGLIHNLKTVVFKGEVVKGLTNYLYPKENNSLHFSWCRIRLDIYSCWSAARLHTWAATFF